MQHRQAYIEAISKLQDALNELRRIPGHDCTATVYGVRQQIMGAQRELENELQRIEQTAEQDVLAKLARRQRAAGEVA